MDNRIIDTLKYMPVGIRLYSPIYGECSLNFACNNIVVNYYIEGKVTAAIFLPDGRKTPNGEVMLFPTKEDHNWDNYLLVRHMEDMIKGYSYPLENGDYIKFKYKDKKYCAIFKELNYNQFNYHALLDIDTKEVKYNDFLPLVYNKEFSISFIYVLSEVRKKNELDSYLERLGKKFNEETKSMIDIKPATNNSPKYQFKPFEKVLVRDTCDDIWKACFFSHIEEDSGRYVTTYLTWKYCIPYKGNEHLLNTTDPI